MARPLRVLGGMLVLRRVAAAHVAARHAQAQVHPGVPRLQAVLAAAAVRGDVADLVEMRAGHGNPPARLPDGRKSQPSTAVKPPGRGSYRRER